MFQLSHSNAPSPFGVTGASCINIKNLFKFRGKKILKNDMKHVVSRH